MNSIYNRVHRWVFCGWQGFLRNNNIFTVHGKISEGRIDDARLPEPLTDVEARIRCDNHGLLIDAERQLAFIACEDNAKLLVLDLRTRKTMASFSTGRDPDVLAFDPGLGLLYVASESGNTALFGFEAGTVVKAGETFSGPHAHVVAVDPRTHDVYFPLMNLDGATALRIVRPGS